MRKCQKILLGLGLLAALSLAPGALLAWGFQPGADALIAENGQIQLNWEKGVSPYRLTLIDDGESILLYEGSDEDYFYSGIPDRPLKIRIEDSSAIPQAQELDLTVHYPDITMVWSFLAIGSVLFIFLVTTIVKGHKRFGKLTS